MNLPSTPEEHDPEKSMTLSPTEQTIRDQILQLLRNRTQISDNSSKDFNTVESCVDKVIPHRKNLHSTWQKENLRKAWHELHKEFKELETESITFANKIIGQIDRLVEKIVPILGSNHSLAYKRICLENFISDAEQHRNAADGYISKFNDFMTKFSELTSNEGENESEAKSSSVPSRLLGVVDEEIDAINATLKLVIPDETACCYAAFTGAAVGAVAGAGVTLALGYLSWKTCVLFPVLGFVVSGFYKIYSQKRQDRTFVYNINIVVTDLDDGFI
ncbi:hypothetical protein BJ165DRAFT_257122 [Panaeolus papilionaceus]|nr:hypothetical protein BJ165DRAFT_257122 [Panaeolus papilionaceus]